MKINTFKIDNYKKCPIYYRNFGEHFEYLTVIRGELYTAHINVNPTLYNRLLYWLGIEKTMFSTQQTQKVLIHLRRLAETTIDWAQQNKSKNA